MARGGKREGAGRKPGPPEARRSELIRVRVTVEEKAEIEAAAREAGVSVSAWLRRR
jgi:hypothetical protein